jgi:glycerate 2-kinase
VNPWEQRLRGMFRATVDALDATRLMAPIVAPWRARAARGGAFLVIAFGKAARPMAQALRDGLPGATLRGLVVPPEPDDSPLAPFEVIAGGHPLPTAGSMRAAERALALAATAHADEVVLFLVSGGGSAMLELPAEPTTTLAELRHCYQALVGSGADIVELNIVRRHLSAVKGGRLALAAARAECQQTIEISDVPEREHALVASGPSHPDPTSPADARAILDRFSLWHGVPAGLAERLRTERLPPTLRSGATIAPSLAFVTVGSNLLARRALGAAARAAGALVVEDLSVDDWPYERAADRLLARLLRLRRRHPGRDLAVLTGGEVAVPLPGNPGLGGRNQQFALACARRIRGLPITVLSAGTDGIDGNSPAAGAIVDGTTLARARARGFDAASFLSRYDAFSLLDSLGCTVVTGPTGTNVRDLRIAVWTA